jgi:hypothetical protein
MPPMSEESKRQNTNNLPDTQPSKSQPKHHNNDDFDSEESGDLVESEQSNKQV